MATRKSPRRNIKAEDLIPLDEEIKSIEVGMTIVGGQVVWKCK
jgi:hypothetical protein